MPPRFDFLSQRAPENYVAGLGRGATGFTTRSDLGPAREGPSEDQIKEALAKRAAALNSTGEEQPQQEPPKKDGDDDRFQDPDNEQGLFASGDYDRDDDEADRIYQAVDERMDKRRKARREAREQAEREEYEAKNPKISHQFADLKRALSSVTDEEWASLPEVGDLTGRNKRQKQAQNKRFYAVPDSVLASASAAGELSNTVTESAATDGTATNFADIGRARDKVLQARLDQGTAVDTSSGTATSVDAKGYLTSLAKSEINLGEAQMGDIKRVRSLLESVIRTNPKHAPGWIAAARLEEVAGKQVAARNVIARGCEQCPRSEDCWLENIRLNDKHNSKIIAAQAIRHNDQSVRLWIEAVHLEDDPRSRKKVLRQALDHMPQSVALWKEAVNLEEDPGDALLMLHKATEMIPLSVELWLALARLETPENAQKILNKARKSNPTSHEIWIAAARLQEQLDEPAKVEMVIKRGVQALAKENAMLKREDWFSEALRCEQEGALLTCGAIIRETLGYGLDEDNTRRDVWMLDAREATRLNGIATARAVYAYALRVFGEDIEIWKAAVDLEKQHSSLENLYSILEKAVTAVPGEAVFWRRLATEKWQADDRQGARMVLARAFAQNPGDEDIWLAAVQLESDDHKIPEARTLLKSARQEAGTDRVWIKSASFEREHGTAQSSLAIVSDGLARYPKAAKLYMIKGQVYSLDTTPRKMVEAREAYSAGVRNCPLSVPLWVLAARLELTEGLVVKARSILERGRLAVPQSAELWIESVKVELEAGKEAAAKQLMARALQDVPASRSGPLWTTRIWLLEPRSQRKALALEAIKKVDADPSLFTTVGRIFWAERRLDKATAWFEKAVLLDPDLGDSWAWYVLFLRQHGTREKRQDVVEKCVAAKPRHGPAWQPVNKDPKHAGLDVRQILDKVVDSLS